MIVDEIFAEIVKRRERYLKKLPVGQWHLWNMTHTGSGAYNQGYADALGELIEWIKDQPKRRGEMTARKRLVIIESPFAIDTQTHVTYARRCVRDSLDRGEAPIASHLLHTQDGILDDNIPKERKLGIEAGLAWVRVCDAMVLYTDYGISHGMMAATEEAISSDTPIETRSIGKNPQ